MHNIDSILFDFAKIVKYPVKVVYSSEAINLTGDEKKIFDLLLRVIRDNKLSTTLRVAGGWVRDKILHRPSKDIDIAIDNMSGVEFATMVKMWMDKNGIDTKTVSTIKANPEQSKHLETATTFIFGYPIDFVNLRTETYADNDSRIPDMSYGTPEEDAMRRDFTINSLFFNINSNKIEDFTGKGLEDLKSGYIRTPLPASQTFYDDPLRLLRAIRFAARYGFKLDQEIIDAAKDSIIKDKLKKKISKERIAEELVKILGSSEYPENAFKLIKEFDIRDEVFDLPHGLDKWDMDQNNLHHQFKLWDHLVKVVENMSTLLKSKYKVDDETKIILLLASFMHDLGKLEPSVKGTKELEGKLISTYNGHEKHSKRIAQHILHQLKLSNSIIDNVLMIIENAGKAEQFVHSKDEVTDKQLGRFIRKIDDVWKNAIYLAIADDLSKADLVDSDTIINKYDNMISRIDNISKITKPLLNGNEITSILNIKPGPVVGAILAKLYDWQAENHAATKDDAKKWLINSDEVHSIINTNNISFNKRSLRLSNLISIASGKRASVKNGYLSVTVPRPNISINEDKLIDRGEYHITIINPKEFRKLSKEVKDNLTANGINIDGEPEYVGLGKVDEGSNSVYFIVVSWPEANRLREALGLDKYDFHITLGFKVNDIHNVRKDYSTLIERFND